MRDAGHFYINLSYSNLSGTSFFGSNFKKVKINRYTQHDFGFYAEVGVVSRWLTLTLDGQLYRRNVLSGQGRTEGIGDLRLGFWTGAIVKPVRLSFGVLVGLPAGDRAPDGPKSDPFADQIAKSLPTGDGEWDVEFKASLGYSFGRHRYWPLEHYLTAEAGYWLRTRSIHDAFTYKLEIGTKFPWTFIDRFWFVIRLFGVESFASNAQAANSFSGLGDGVTYTSFAFEVIIRIYAGLSVSYGLDTAFRARSVISSLHHKVSISYDF
ncbi:MAG: hypothetical protein KC609_18075 [Myxococcales bacterium]|nr:hypothetical protein [Myxococcales bacterium]